MDGLNRLRELAGMPEQKVTENTRQVTDALHTMMDEGILDPRQVADACLGYMSEDDVAQMAHVNEFPTSEEDVYGDDDEDGYNEPGGGFDGDPGFE